LPPAQAANYYVSPSGSDSAPGTLSQPFQTIQKAASIMVAGDTVLIRAGVYRETVTPANSGTQNAPITYMPYNGESVTVSGADVIPASSWTLSSGNIYAAPIPWDLGNGANQVFLDGQMMIEAQWPNTTLDVSHPTVALTSGGSYVDRGTSFSTGTITDVNLPSRPPGYWNGAILNICLGSCWYWLTTSVTDSSTPHQLTFTFPPGGGSIEPEANNSYFLTGLLGELDSPGEWFRVAGTSALYFWPPLSDNPSGHLVEAKHRQLAFDLSGLSFVTVQGVALFAATIDSDSQSQYLVLDGVQGQYLSHVPILVGEQYPGNDGYNAGIALRGTKNVLRNSFIAFSSGSGVYLEGTGQRVFNNVIRDTDYRTTYASPVYAGTTPQNQHLIAYNTIYNSGRFGIYHTQYFGTGRILHNEIYDYGLQTNDLGCNYTYGTNGMGTEIAYNLCHDGRGLILNNSTPYATGIYLDNGSSNFVVHHNVAWNVPFALSLNTPGENYDVFNNTFIGTFSSFTAYPNATYSGSAIQNNIFVGPINANPITGAVMSDNVLPGTDPLFVDPTNHNYQLQPNSPAIGAGLIIPPYTNGFTGSAPDIGAYDHTKLPWKAGVQNAAVVSAPSYAPTLTPGTIAVVTGSVPFDSGASVVLTDGANVDWPVPLVYAIASPPQLAFQVPSAAAPGVAMIAITNGDGTVSLSSAPLFAGPPPVSIVASQGSQQSAPVETLFATSLQAKVMDAGGNPVPDAAVTFAAPASGAGGGFALSATVATNSSGVAVAPAFMANAIAGTYTVTASASGVGVPAGFGLTNTGGPLVSQTITFGPLSNLALGSSPPALRAAASSGLTVTFTSNTTAVCAVSVVTITLLTVGPCSITASQGGNSTYAPASAVVQTFMVAGATPQTITFSALNNVIAWVDPFTVSATASSGLTVAFVSTTPTVCTVLGTTVSIVSTGTCSITASQSGNSIYQVAPFVTQTFTVSEPSPLAIGVGPDFGDYPVGNTQIALVVSGGVPPYTWSLAAGALPPGTAIRTDIPSWFQSTASAGIIGVTTAPGTASFTLTVTDSASNTATRACTVEVLSLLAVNVYPLPDAFTGTAFSASLQAFGVTGALSWNVPSFSSLPLGLFLSGATISGSPTTPGAYSFNLTATDSTGSVYGGYTLNVYGPGFAGSSALGNVTIGTALAPPITLTGKGGTPPYTFQGYPPSGLSLSSSGAITGTPTGGNGTNSFNVTITDHAGLSYTKTFAINYTGAPGQSNLPYLNYPLPFSDPVGGAQQWRLQVFGGTQPYTWSVTGLPVGLSLQTANLPSYSADTGAEISGAPIATGTYNVIVSVTDSSSPALTVQQPVPLSVTALDADYPSSSATRGTPYSSNFRALGGSGSYTWALESGSMPAGVTLNPSTGLISGTPLENGSFYPTFLITSTTASGSLQLTRSISLNVNSPTNPQISMAGNQNPPDVTVNSSYYWQLQFCCGAGSLADSVTSGALPPGLKLDASTGLISGTPSATGEYAFTIQATDSANATNFGVRIFTLNVSPIQVSAPVPNANLGSNYSTLFTATGGAGPYSWALASGSALLPEGITLNSVGLLSGTPLTEGVFYFSYIVSDSANHSFTGNAAEQIFPPLLVQTISFGALNNVVSGTAPFSVSATASSGLPVSFASTTNAVCTMVDDTVTLVSLGTCTIQATQAGNTNYAAAPPITQSFQVTASLCDLKQNGNIGVSDAQAMINEALGVAPAASDLNSDGSINVSDVQIEINAILGLGCTAN
jgi:hypothetical protein